MNIQKNVNLYDYLKIGNITENAPVLALDEKINLTDVKFYHIKELTFEEDSPRREAFENVISAIRMQGVVFIYLVFGSATNVSFYVGVAKDLSFKDELELDIDDVANRVLKPSIEGNFRGSVLEEVKEKNELVFKMQNMKRFAKISGVPSIYKDKEDFQGIDRLIDIMSGDEFMLLILAKPISNDKIDEIEQMLFDAYNQISLLSKAQIQQNDGVSITKTKGKSEGKSESFGENNSTSSVEGKTYSRNTGKQSGTSSSRQSSTSSSSSSDNYTYGDAASISSSITESKSSSTTHGSNSSENSSLAQAVNLGKNIGFELTNKMANEWLKYMDDVMFSRINYGKNRGLFNSSIYIMSNEQGNITKLGNTIMSIFSGDENNKNPLNVKKLDIIHDKNEIENIKNLQISKIGDISNLNKITLRRLNSQSAFYNTNYLSTNELSIIASLPKKEVVGLSLKEEVEFGLNLKEQVIEKDAIFLGNMVQSGKILQNEIYLQKSWLDKHIFIAGVTGSGKTTTCQRILKSANLPFLVIEPAKTEYRTLLNDNKDIIIFTLGDDRVAPFRLNPFEFFPHENISSRVDMIKANIEASFDMEAAIPQIIEAALYECYEDYGWDIATSTNSKFIEPFKDGVFAFPTLSDLIEKTTHVVKKQGFDDRLKNDYIGSINARLQGLLVGQKSFMLNCSRSINFVDLLEKNIVLELEQIKNGAEKSLIMGFILININEALKIKYKECKNSGKEFRHITLVEEAHRLLSKFTPGYSVNKKLGVETFADMLAEVRKYGESLIIVDQIPNKLTPEVLKNTNTKIVHKLFAQDDKEAIGNTMSLSDEQKNFLSNLETGRAIISNPNFTKPIQVQIKQLENAKTTGIKDINDEDIRKNSLLYYRNNYKSGVILGLEKYGNKPSFDEIDMVLSYEFYKFELEWKKALNSDKINLEIIRNLINLKKIPKDISYLVKYIFNKFYKNSDMPNETKEYLNLIFDKIINSNDKEIVFVGDYFHIKNHIFIN